MVVMYQLQFRIITIVFITFQFNLAADQKGFLDFLFSPCKCKCGVSNREARFIGGEFLRGHEFPWLSTIQIITEDTAISGTLINNKYVISAASSLIGFSPYDIKITLGQFDRCFADISSNNISIDKILIHPDFNVDTRANDLALLRFTNPINFERRISPICLSIPGFHYLGQVATITGWFSKPSTVSAEIESEKSENCRPRKLGLPILNNRECLESVKNPEDITIDKGCIGVIGTPSIVCSNDAGGPVMYRSHGGIYELIGVLSDLNRCNGDHSGIAFYTKINNHLSWITRNTKDACYCFKT